MRAVVALAVESGQTVEYWLDQTDPRHLETALELRAEQARELERIGRRGR